MAGVYKVWQEVRSCTRVTNSEKVCVCTKSAPSRGVHWDSPHGAMACGEEVLSDTCCHSYYIPWLHVRQQYDASCVIGRITFDIDALV